MRTSPRSAVRRRVVAAVFLVVTRVASAAAQGPSEVVDWQRVRGAAVNAAQEFAQFDRGVGTPSTATKAIAQGLASGRRSLVERAIDAALASGDETVRAQATARLLRDQRSLVIRQGTGASFLVLPVVRFDALSGTIVYRDRTNAEREGRVVGSRILLPQVNTSSGLCQLEFELTKTRQGSGTMRCQSGAPISAVLLLS